MNLFVDTSALVKLFHEEEGSQIVSEILTSQGNNIWISELARIEFISALLRKFRNKEIDDEKLALSISGFEESLSLLTSNQSAIQSLRKPNYY